MSESEETAAPAGGPAPSVLAVDNASAQMKLLNGEVAVQTSDYRQDLSPGTGTGSRPACRRCAQVENILQYVAELPGVVRRLHSTREAEEE